MLFLCLNKLVEQENGVKQIDGLKKKSYTYYKEGGKAHDERD